MKRKCKIKNCKNDIHSLGLCTKHYTRQRRYDSTDKPKTKSEQLLLTNSSYCPSCEKVKSIKEFNKDKQTFNGFSTYCKLCNNKKGKTRYKLHKDEYKSYGLIKKFGITLEDYNILLNNQDGVCAICEKSQFGKALAVDHCHKTKVIRGLLCDSCNLGLGKFNDDKKLINKASKYLEGAR